MAVYLPILTTLLAGVSLAGGSVTLLISLGTVGAVLYPAPRPAPCAPATEPAPHLERDEPVRTNT